MNENIVRDNSFEEVAEVKADSKNRISLGAKGKIKTRIYKVYQNALGQIVLDPQVTIPAHEQWLFKNAEAAESVQSGLKDAKQRKLVKPREDYSKYRDEA